MNKTFPSLYHRGRKGELRIWTVSTEGNLVKTEYGVVGGKMIYSEYKCFAKNAGKANATTDITQAHSEAQSDWNYNIERKYSLTPEEASESVLKPMLAKEFNDRYATYPGYVQPKLDGFRCMAFWEDGKIKLLSRGNKEFTVPKHINLQLEKIIDENSVLDGELYIHPDVMNFEEFSSAVKKQSPSTQKVEYWVYDMPVVNGVDTLKFKERLKALQELSLSGDVKLVETVEINSKDEVLDYEKKCRQNGYEGAIYRSFDNLYSFGYRSSSLLKVKTFEDAEFVVLDVNSGKGKFEGCAVFTCQNNLNNLTFECTMSTSIENKQEQFSNKKEYIGQLLTIKFFGRTKNDLPRFPVAKTFRPKFDLGVVD